MCGVTGLALTMPVTAKDKGLLWNPGGPVEFMTTVDAVRDVPVGNLLPGLHVDVKVDGRTVDVYIAPMDFCRKFEIKILKGDTLQIIGNQLPGKAGETDVVLTREFTVGERGTKVGVFRPTLTMYLRNDDGPFWIELR